MNAWVIAILVILICLLTLVAFAIYGWSKGDPQDDARVEAEIKAVREQRQSSQPSAPHSEQP